MRISDWSSDVCSSDLVTAAVARAGAPLPAAILCGALVAGAVGIVLERLIIHRLYHRPLDSIVATWGISLIATQGLLILVGPTMPGIGTPLGSFTIGAYSYSGYRLVLMLVAVLLLASSAGRSVGKKCFST